MKSIAGNLPGALACGSDARARSRSSHRQHSHTPSLHHSVFLLLFLSVIDLPPSACRAQDTAFTYQYNAQATTTLATGTNVSVRATLNGVEIPGSRASVILSSRSIEALSLTRSFVANISAADVLTLQFTGSSTSGHLIGGGIGSTRPSVCLTITRIQQGMIPKKQITKPASQIHPEE